jgi:hypothetical protein
MNLYDSSKEKNYEIGYSMDTMKTSNKFLKTIIWGDILSLRPVLHLEGYHSKHKEEEERKKKLEQEKKVFEPDKVYEVHYAKHGYCIRCRTSIRLNPSNPLCNSCYITWRNYGNPDFEENYCHICGRETRTAMNKPLCYDCYKKGQYINSMNNYRY